MTTTKTTYIIRSYNDGDTIGEIELTGDQFCRYEKNAQMPEGLIALDDLPGSPVLSITMSGKTTVYLEAE